MRSWRGIAAIGVWTATTLAGATSMVVTGNAVNLRSRPAVDSEIVGQLANGQVLTVRQADEQWAEVAPPTNVSLWVYREFIKDGRVSVAKLKVRSGPGFVYRDVGTIVKGTPVAVVGQRNDWVEIQAPETCSVWVSSKFLKPLDQPAPPPAPVRPPAAPLPERTVAETPPPARPSPPPVVAPPAPKPPPPPDLVKRGLVPLDGQGNVVQVEGWLQPAGYLIGPPSRFRLVEKENGSFRTVCYIKGNNAQLNTFLGRRLRVVGRQYWLQGARDAIVVPEQITPL